jgi:hypothetical protein
MNRTSRCLIVHLNPAAQCRRDDTEEKVMQTFIIERHVPGAGDLSPEDLQKVAEKSNRVVATLGVPYVWHESFAAGDKIYCVHSAESADAIYEHARRGGFPADKVTPVGGTFGPESAGER